MKLKEKFYEAIDSNNMIIIKDLVENKNLDFTELGVETLIFSIRTDNKELFDFVLSRKEVDVFARANEALRDSCKKNKMYFLKKILELEEVNPSFTEEIHFSEFLLKIASQNGNNEAVELLINEYNLNPADHHNASIAYAYLKGKMSTVRLLWKDERVKESLFENDEEMYHELMTIDKLNDF